MVTQEYIEGIREGRDYKRRFNPNPSEIRELIDNINRTIASGFDARSPVGQMLRGEREFWLNQLRLAE